jgi:ribosomal protein S2
METLLVLPENNEQLKAIKAVLKALRVEFVSSKGDQYDEAFVKKITESCKQAKEGKVSILDANNLWK